MHYIGSLDLFFALIHEHHVCDHLNGHDYAHVHGRVNAHDVCDLNECVNDLE